MDLKLILMTVKTIFKKEATEGIRENQLTAIRKQEKTGRDVEQIVDVLKKRKDA